jgi:hypothetical protein
VREGPLDMQVWHQQEAYPLKHGNESAWMVILISSERKGPLTMRVQHQQLTYPERRVQGEWVC